MVNTYFQVAIDPERMNISTLHRLPAVLLFFVCLSATTHAQVKKINLTSLSTKDGLSSNNINSILKDQFGLVWIGTDDGLARFDGSKFTIYKHLPGSPGSLQANEILSLHEDRKGQLWIGTSGGSLSKYDRKKDAFTHIPAGPKSGVIKNNVIRAVLSDYKGNIWVAHFDGINILNPLTDKTSAIPINNKEASSTISDPPMTLFEDASHTMWIGTANGLYQYKPEQKLLKKINRLPAFPANSTAEIVNTIAEDAGGDIWIGTSLGLNKLNPDKKTYSPVNLNQSDAVFSSNYAVNTIAVDSNQLWIGTGDGMKIFDLLTGSVRNFQTDPRNVHSLTAKAIRCIYLDKDGICWIGTIGGGINKFDRNLNLFNYVTSNPFDKQGLPSPIVSAFAERKDGQLFIGTEGAGLSIFNPANQLFKKHHIPSRRAKENNELEILCLQMSSSEKLLIGTFGDGLIELNPITGNYRQFMATASATALNLNDLYCITELKNGTIWAGTNGSGINVFNKDLKVLYRYTPNPERSNDRLLPLNGYIRTILEDKDGDIWIATHGGGIALYNPASDSFKIFNTANSQLPNDKIHSLLEDRNGTIWIGTFGSGVAWYSKKTNQFGLYTEKDGLQNSMGYKLLESENGLIWVSSNKGISSIDPSTGKINNYNHHNGIQKNNFVRGSGIRLSNGDLYFGGKEGFNYFDPSELITNNNVPATLLTDLRISNQSISPTEDGPITEHISVASEINLDYKQNFALDFVALNYTAPGQNQYAYRLEGFDKDWNEVGNSNTATYTNLDPGQYTFRIRASNNDGVWNNTGSSIRVIVHPPIWKTGYAYAFYFFSLAALLFYMRYLAVQKWNRKFALEQERVKTEQERREVERILELDRLKIKFLTNLSHEFRTPISLIMGPVDSLLAKEHNSGAANQLKLVKHNARRLLNLVNQLLDFRKMEEQELKLNCMDADLIPFMEDISVSFKDLAERKNIHFRYSSAIDQLYTSFDPDKIERILFNVLSNAFKFTNKGGEVTLELQAVQLSDTSFPWVEIKITDTGIGIPADKTEKIFDVFFQSDTGSSILNQGTGIGLSITQEFVKMHGGTISVESTLGKGSCFSILLPLKPIEQPVTETATLPVTSNLEKPLSEPSTETVRDPLSTEVPVILLVEDNDDFRFYLKENLRLHYKVIEAGNGKEGWQKTLTHHPQLIVSDISMPEMDGIQFCQKLKADKRTTHIPVVLLTALNGEEEQLAGLKTGASDYITKPFNFELLNAKIKNLLVLNDTFKNTYSKQIKALAPDLNIQSGDEKLLQSILKYIDENLNNPQLSVEELSKQIGMSRSSLYSKLLELTGQTPVEFIRSIKLDKAAVLLEKSSMNVAEIAYTVGFSTPNYFAKSFKAKFNMLPSEYIHKLRKES